MPDDQVEASLRSGDNAGTLEDYFGPALYDEVRRLEKEVAGRSVRGGERVLILPGIMGSKLGYRRKIVPIPDIIWADPLCIVRGRLTELALGGPARKIEAVGVILLAYLTLKLRLRLAGYDADFWAYDWRRSLRDLGKQLAAGIAAEGRPVKIVAHSMGGLVARSSLRHAPDIERIVMLGTPNFGSFAPIQAVRGAYSLVRKVAQIDIVNNIDTLTAMFGGFPGLLEMIPSPTIAGATNLFDLGNWPQSGQRPAATALGAAQRVQDEIPVKGVARGNKKPTDIVMIAGVNQETVVGARVEGTAPEEMEFVYTLSTEGDGTVPLRCALLPGATTYYVDGEHGRLPSHSQIQSALPSILSTGTTSELLKDPPRRRATVQRSVPERLMQPPVEMVPRGAIPSVREQRLLIEEVAAPDPQISAGVSLAAAAAAKAEQKQPMDIDSDMVVVGRGRERRLELTLARGSIVDADAQCYVLGIFKTVQPGGAANALDAATGGAISDLVGRRMFSANIGDVSILPNGSHPLRARSIAFVGLGAFDQFAPETLEVVGENLVRTLVAGGVDDFAVVPFGAGSGELTQASVRHLMCGFLRGLLDSDKDNRFRGVTICEIDENRFALIRDALKDLAWTKLFDDFEVTFRDRELQPRFVAAARGVQRKERIYLIVREAAESEADPSARPPLIASVLTTGDKAAIHKGKQPPKPADGPDLEQQLRKLDDIENMSEADLDEFGEKLSALVLDDEVRQVLSHYGESHLVVVHDAGASRIPWEAVKIGTGYPALKGGLSHRYEADNLSVAKWLERRQASEVLSVLLVINPTLDLQGAEKEGKRIKSLFDALGEKVSCKLLHGNEAQKGEVLRCFGSGEYDVIHYAGHAFFDPNQRMRSGLLCANQEVLAGSDLAGIGNLPTMMFFNACEAARVRGQAKRAKKPPHPDIVRRGIGFAEALLRGGIANFIGTYWPVGDAAAEAFAGEFYRLLLEGKSLDDSTRAGREKVKEADSRDWADYVFYGDPDFVLKHGARP